MRQDAGAQAAARAIAQGLGHGGNGDWSGGEGRVGTLCVEAIVTIRLAMGWRGWDGMCCCCDAIRCTRPSMLLPAMRAGSKVGTASPCQMWTSTPSYLCRLSWSVYTYVLGGTPARLSVLPISIRVTTIPSSTRTNAQLVVDLLLYYP